MKDPVQPLVDYYTQARRRHRKRCWQDLFEARTKQLRKECPKRRRR